MSAPADRTPWTRRAVLASGFGGLGGLAAVLAGCSPTPGSTAAGSAVAPSAASDVAASASPLPTPSARAVLPSGTDLQVPGISALRTPAADFFQIDLGAKVSPIEAASWKLRIHGLVAQEVEITYADLLAAGLVEKDVTLACVSNAIGGDLIGSAVWQGVPLAPFLAKAQPAADADMVLSTGADGWTASTPLAALTDTSVAAQALLAVGMNGEPLQHDHGFPVRMIVPGLYGFVSATKWVSELKITRFADDKAYWSTRGWSDHGPMRVSSRIDVPRRNSDVVAGKVWVGGVAWSPRGITSVEVKIDEGPWRPADLGAEINSTTWRQWRWAWDATAGNHGISVRAIDGAGAVQVGEQHDVAPDGATGWQTIRVTVT